MTLQHRKIFLKALLCIALLVILPSCQTTQSTANVERVADDTIDASHPRVELVLDSKHLVGVVAMTNVRFGTTVNFQRVEFGLQNLSGRDLAIEYRIQWQDEQGFTVNQHSLWSPIKLGPREIRNVQSLGKVPEAWKIQLTIRYTP